MKPNGWYRTLLNDPTGTIKVAQGEMKVHAIRIKSEALKDAVDRAYLDKYKTPGALNYARDLCSVKSRATTIELVPFSLAGSRGAAVILNLRRESGASQQLHGKEPPARTSNERQKPGHHNGTPRFYFRNQVGAALHLGFHLPRLHNCAPTVKLMYSNMQWLRCGQRMMLVHDAPSASNLPKAYGESKFELLPLTVRVNASAPPSAVAKGTSFPAVILMSWKSNATGFSDHDKNLSQVAM